MPFSESQFLDVFRHYNEAVWPAQLALAALGVAAVAIAVRGGSRSGALVGVSLAVLWAWAGLVYHVGFFRGINPAATIFGAAFVVQAVLLAWAGLSPGRLAFDVGRDVRGTLGLVLVAWALAVYPAAGLLLGHRYPAMPTFGLPCPLTILTIGLLVWAGPRAPRVLMVIPLLWSAIGTIGAFRLGMPEDLSLAAAALVGLSSLVRHPVRPHFHARPAT